MKKIIFAHGFGVRADSKGLFTDIRAALAPDYDGTLLDLNELRPKQVIIVHPLSEQTKILQAAIESAGETVDVVAHSQGTLVTAALPSGLPIRRIILLAPPVQLKSTLMETTYAGHPLTKQYDDGHYELVRKNGDRMRMTPGYIAEIQRVDPVAWINRLAQHYEVIIFRATEDEMLDHLDDGAFEHVNVVRLPGDHDFDPPDRQRMLETLKSILDQNDCKFPPKRI